MILYDLIQQITLSTGLLRRMVLMVTDPSLEIGCELGDKIQINDNINKEGHIENKKKIESRLSFEDYLISKTIGMEGWEAF